MKKRTREIVNYVDGWIGFIFTIIFLYNIIYSEGWRAILFVILGLYATWLIYKGMQLFKRGT
jgi:uncharacterized membrane protein